MCGYFLCAPKKFLRQSAFGAIQKRRRRQRAEKLSTLYPQFNNNYTTRKRNKSGKKRGILSTIIHKIRYIEFRPPQTPQNPKKLSTICKECVKISTKPAPAERARAEKIIHNVHKGRFLRALRST